MVADLTVVVPVYNECENLSGVVDAVGFACGDLSWEIVFVDDDSTDGSESVLRQIVFENPKVRYIRRIGRRGLSSACIEGMLACASPYVAVMDGDLQHDEALLPQMLSTLKNDSADVVVGSRYLKGGGTGELQSDRVKVSQIATKLSHLLVKTPLSDPMSGFFMLKREVIDDVVRKLYGKGFKILLDIAASSDSSVRFREIPYTMRARAHGESKLSWLVVSEYLYLLAKKGGARLIPHRFIPFSLVGLVGVLVNMVILGIGHRWLEFGFAFSQAFAAFIAMTSNYILNNIVTYHDVSLKGKAWWKGLLSFYLVCAVGVLLNVSFASFLYDHKLFWWASGMIGIVVGSVWNFALSSVFTWGTKVNNPEGDKVS